VFRTARSVTVVPTGSTARYPLALTGTERSTTLGSNPTMNVVAAGPVDVQGPSISRHPLVHLPHALVERQSVTTETRADRAKVRIDESVQCTKFAKLASNDYSIAFGSVTVNVEPASGALSTRRSPPIPRTSSRLIANPRPVPWCTRVRLVST